MSMSTNLHKRYYYYIKQVIYTTDFGYFFPENVEETFYQQERYEVDMKLPSETNHLSNFGTIQLLMIIKLIFIIEVMISFNWSWLI